MITLHHLINSRSQRIIWLLEELELDYELKSYERQGTLQAPDTLKNIHPLGKSPIIEVDSAVLAESGAIIEYLLNYAEKQQTEAPSLRPAPDDEAYADYLQWMHYAEGSAMPWLFAKLLMGRLGMPPVPFWLRPFGKMLNKGMSQKLLRPQIKTHMEYWEKTLEEHTWFAGEAFTAADIQMGFVLLAARKRGDFSRYPKLNAFLQRMRERPAYQKAVAKGGEFNL